MPENLKKALYDLVPASIKIKKEILMDEYAPLDLKNRVADSVLDRVYGKPGPAVDDANAETLDKLDQMLINFRHAVDAEAE